MNGPEDESESEVLIVLSKDELLSFGYLCDNNGKEVIYDGRTYLLIKHGIRYIPRLMFSGFPNQTSVIKSRKPQWETKLNDLILTIIDIN